jgi:uncharacterized phage protein (TIGR01671 family)
MKREIKFRAIAKTNNLMVFGDLIFTPNQEHRIIWFELKGETPLDIDYESFNEVVDTSTIGQYTGRKDKNGKEIYEGDIIEKHFGKYEVLFHDCEWVFTKLNDYYKQQFYKLNFFDDKNFEVVGNIFENNKN